MQYAFRFLVVVMPLLAACTDAPNESTTQSLVLSSNRITGNRITGNRIAANRIAANRIAANRIAADRITENRLTVNSSTAALLATAEGRELFEVLVGCALPEDITLVARVDGSEVEFKGEIGLTPQWLHAALDREGQGWVSACVFARINAHAVSLPISIHGPNRALRPLDPVEREEWSLQEGAFYGNMFTPLDQPIVWIACRGADKAATPDAGELRDRDCAEADPEHPGLNQCGFTFAGDCDNFFEEVRREAACERFSEHEEFYQRCHAGPIGDARHHGARHHDDDDHIFREVITTYVCRDSRSPRCVLP